MAEAPGATPLPAPVAPVREGDLALWPDEPRSFLRAGTVLVTMLVSAGVTAAFLGEQAGALLALAAGFAAFGTLAWNVRRPRVRVGADGLAVSDRFHAWADVERIERDETAYGRTHHLAWLVLRSGARVHLGGRLGLVGHRALAVVDAAYEGLERRIAEHRAREPAAYAGELSRGERPVAQWTAEIRAKATEGGFRDGRIARADLLAALEDPTADPTARAAAALALKKDLRDEERVRVRVAASATAAPKVRVALEAAADESVGEEKVAELTRRVAE